MKKNLCENLPLNERADFLQNNADDVEMITYMKQFTHEEIGLMKDSLSEISIEMNDIEIEKKDVAATYSEKLKPLVRQKKNLLTNIKQKAILTDEECYKFVDQEEGMVGFYNAIGDLVSSRPIMPSERQKTIFSINKNGTND